MWQNSCQTPCVSGRASISASFCSTNVADVLNCRCLATHLLGEFVPQPRAASPFGSLIRSRTQGGGDAGVDYEMRVVDALWAELACRARATARRPNLALAKAA
jgi:hypothetical protein